MTQYPLSRTVSLFVLAAGAAAAISQTGCAKGASAKVEDSSAPPVHVDTADVTTVDAPIVLRLTGSLKGMKEANLAANAAGRVMKMFVERGDEVKEGAVVAQLDTSSAALALKQAQVDVLTQKTVDTISQTECARYEKLIANGAISPADYDNVTAKCKTAPLNRQNAEVRRNIAAKNVADGTIRAPFSGIVSERYVEVGEYVSAQSKVIGMVQTGDLRVELAVPEANIASVKQGADVGFQVAAYPDKTFRGTLRFVSGALRESTRDLVCEALAPNTEKLLRPGMFANVEVATGMEKLPSVPWAAVFERQDKKRVFVVVEGRIEERVLEPGPEVNGRLTAHAGIKQGEKVVIGNLAVLTNGARVQ